MDPATKKTVLRLFSYGLYAVTARHGEEISGMTANWLMQSSFEPPLITLAVESGSHSRKVIEAARAFAVNVYAASQREFAGRLGRTWAKHPDKLDGIAWQPGTVTGSPILEDALAWIECRVDGTCPSGDHVLLVAEVVDAGLHQEGLPLTLKDAGFKYAG